MKTNSPFFAALSLALAVVFLLGSCDDIIEKDISGDTPVIVMPQTNDTIPANPVHFKWNELEGATKYHLEIVSPSFANIDVFAIDSIVTGTNFYVSLDSAEYQFRLTALNAGYESHTTAPVTFWVGTSQGATQEEVVLNTPGAGVYLNENFNGQFNWEILNGADHYMFEMHQGSTFSDPTVDIIPDIQAWTVTSYNGTQLPEGEYIWGVKAYMTSGAETIYTKRTFYIDTTNPGTAAMLTPANNTLISAGDITFTWSLPTDNGTVQSPVISKLEISTTTNFSNPQTLTVNGTTRTVTLSAGTYYWRVKLTDSAGNTGNTPSTYHTLTLF